MDHTPPDSTQHEGYREGAFHEELLHEEEEEEVRVVAIHEQLARVRLGPDEEEDRTEDQNSLLL